MDECRSYKLACTKQPYVRASTQLAIATISKMYLTKPFVHTQLAIATTEERTRKRARKESALYSCSKRASSKVGRNTTTSCNRRASVRYDHRSRSKPSSSVGYCVRERINIIQLVTVPVSYTHLTLPTTPYV